MLETEPPHSDSAVNGAERNYVGKTDHVDQKETLAKARVESQKLVEHTSPAATAEIAKEKRS